MYGTDEPHFVKLQYKFHGQQYKGFIEKEHKPEFLLSDLKSLKARICLVYIGKVDIYSKRNNTAVLHSLDIYNKT